MKPDKKPAALSSQPSAVPLIANIGTLVYPRLDQCVPSPANAGRAAHYDPAALQELADSIKARGVVEPILVRPVLGSPATNPQFEIIAGERRWRASKLAGKETIPAIAKTLIGRDVAEIQIIENLQREDLAPLDEAAAYQRLIAEFQLTTADIAQRIGKSLRHVQARLQLLKLPAQVKEALAAGTITADTALKLHALPPDRQHEVVDELASAHAASAKPVSVRAAREIIAPEKPSWERFPTATPPPATVPAGQPADWPAHLDFVHLRGCNRAVLRDILAGLPRKRPQSRAVVKAWLRDLARQTTAPAPDQSAPAAPPDKLPEKIRSLCAAINAGQPLRWPKNCNAVRLTYLIEKIVLKEDLDAQRAAGVPVRVEFGKVPFQGRHRPNRAKFEVIR